MTSAVDLFEAELRLCGVHEGETVAVLSQTERQRAYARDFLAAAQRGARRGLVVPVASALRSSPGCSRACDCGR